MDMSVHLYQNADQQHDDGTGNRYANALKSFETGADTFIPQGTHLFVRVQAGFGFINSGHRKFLSL